MLVGPLLGLLLHCRRLSLCGYHQTLFQKHSKKSYVPFQMEPHSNFDSLSVNIFTLGPSSNHHKYTFKSEDGLISNIRLSPIDVSLLNLNISASLFIRLLINSRIKDMLSILHGRLESLVKTSPCDPFLPAVLWDFYHSDESSYILGTILEFGENPDRLFNLTINVCPFTGNFLISATECSDCIYFTTSKSENFHDVALDIYRCIHSLTAKVR